MTPKFKVKVNSSKKLFKNILVITISLFSFFLVFFSKSDYFLINNIKTISSDIVSPISRFVSAPIYVISNLKSEFDQFRSYKFENKILKEEIIRLKKWQTLAIQNSRENKVLKKLLNATDNNLNLVKTASLINRNDTIYSKLINVNAGYQDGIKVNMSAINERGLVGRVVDTTAEQSRILLLTDPNLSISIKTISDGIFSLVKGSGDNKHLVSTFIKDNKLPKVGDIVVSSGTAQIFPVDLLVGKITKVEKNRFFILPFVDFKNIDYVQIVTSE